MLRIIRDFLFPQAYDLGKRARTGRAAREEARAAQETPEAAAGTRPDAAASTPEA